mmetsp:Transcript_26227/g.61970  ORF Transcript_26227/g.61970 Transcript_26227/m.61970 type:complete len:240 (-) Transcript_26227:1531-2250(-)
MDGRFVLLCAAVGMVAIDGPIQRLRGAKARLGAGGLEALQRIGLGQLHLVVREGRVARHVGQQADHAAGMRGQGVGRQADTVIARIGGQVAAHGLGGFGDLLGTERGGAAGQQAGQQLGAAGGVGRIGAKAGAAQGQHEVHARNAVARDHPDLQPVGQGLLGDLGHGQGLVLAERGQFLGQLDAAGLGQAGKDEAGSNQAEAEGGEEGRHGRSFGIRAWRPPQRGRRPGRPAWQLACGR